VARFLSDSGLGAALLGRTVVPSREELGAVVGFQVLLTGAIVIVGGLIGLVLGGDVLVPVLMLTCLPIATFRLPTALMMERDLSYRVIARAEVIEAVVGYSWAIATVAAGWGVWGLASAAPVRVAAGSIAMVRFGTVGFVGPRPNWRLVRPLLSFGIRFQAVNAVVAARDQGLNAGIAIVGGISTLGIWSLAFRIMQVPLMLFLSLVRISYPAMARLLDAKEDPRGVIERGIGIVAVALSPILVGIGAGSSALLPPLVGERWAAVPDILAFASLAMMISAPVSIPCVGYLLASGEVSKVLKAASLQGLTWVAIALALLGPIGVGAIGIGWLSMAFVEVGLLSFWVGRQSGARVLLSLARPLGVAVAAGGAGLALSQVGDHRVVMGIAGLLAAEVLLIGGLRLLAHSELTSAMRVTGRALTTARAG
jgi:O-antigen/teichoic acid export membrane protein